MINEYSKKIETYFGSLTEVRKDLLNEAVEQIASGYKQGTYIYDSDIKKEAYAIHYGPIYAMQSSISLCNEKSVDFFIRQPDEIFVHGCAHFPESYGLKGLFSLKKWNLGESKINLLEREVGWKPLIQKISMIPRRYFWEFDFIKDKPKASKIYSDSKTPLYIYQNCLNEDQNSEIIKTIIDCYKEAPKGAIFLISSITPRDSDWKRLDLTFESIQSQIVSAKCSKIKKFSDSDTHYPNYTSLNFKDLTFKQKSDDHGNHKIYLSAVFGHEFTKYSEKYIKMKQSMTFRYILVRK